jgi:hypothetical protein
MRNGIIFIGVVLVILLILTRNSTEEKFQKKCACANTNIDGETTLTDYKNTENTENTENNNLQQFVKPNYYGIGTWGYHYGEPYYYRNVTKELR